MMLSLLGLAAASGFAVPPEDGVRRAGLASAQPRHPDASRRRTAIHPTRSFRGPRLERLFMPHTRRSQYPSGPAQSDGRPTFPEAKEAAKSRRNPPFARAVSDIARVSPPLLPNRATTPAPPCAGTGDASPVLGSTGHRTAGTKRQPRPGCSPRDPGTRRPSPLTSKRARLLTRGTSKCHDPASFSFLLQL
jgi:hypothetical protein